MKTTKPKILACWAVAVLTAGIASNVCAQDVKIFPISTRTPELQQAKAPLLLTYGGALPREQLYVRVFRGSLNDLRRRKPLPGDSCVLYAATQVYPVSVEGGALRVDGLAEFFALRHQHLQTFTLVFESGENNISDGQLRLWPGDKGVERYFSHAVEWSLDATEPQVAEWNREEQQSARQQQAASQAQSPSWLERIFGLSKVEAASAVPPEKPAAPISSPPPPPPPVRDCQRVTVALRGDTGSSPDSDQLAVLQRQGSSCRAD